MGEESAADAEGTTPAAAVAPAAAVQLWRLQQVALARLPCLSYSFGHVWWQLVLHEVYAVNCNK